VTARIDHVGEALACEEVGLSILREQVLGIAPHMAAVIQFDLARLHAQLALVEQQRIANLIAVAEWNDRALREGARRTDGSEVDYDAERARVDAIFVMVREGLGL